MTTTMSTTATPGRTRTRVLVVAVLLVVVAAGAAYAFWRALGSGTGTAASGTTSALTLSPGTPAAQLYPGGTASVVLTITNPNAGPVRVGSISLDTAQGSSGFGVDGAHSGCGLAALSLPTQTNGGAGWTVTGSGSLSVTLTNALSMATSAANACQGATFTVYLKVAP